MGSLRSTASLVLQNAELMNSMNNESSKRPTVVQEGVEEDLEWTSSEEDEGQ